MLALKVLFVLAGKDIYIEDHRRILGCAYLLWSPCTPDFSDQRHWHRKTKYNSRLAYNKLPLIDSDWMRSVRMQMEWVFCLYNYVQPIFRSTCYFECPKQRFVYTIIEPVHEISNNVVCVTSKPQISLRVRAVWSEPLLVAWVFCDC